MNVDDDLLIAAIDRRDELKKRASVARQVAEEADDDLKRASETVAMLRKLKREQDEFNRAAGSILR